MLETLRIQNYALIDEVEIDFRQGFNVLTGETGAGKSILVGALNLVLGARAAAEVVREGGSRAQVEAVFRMERPPRRLARLLKQHAISLEEGCLLLSRVVGADGRSKAYAAGSMVPVGVLAEIGDELVDFHGQHEHQSLLKAECQLDLLDAFGGTEAAAEAVG
ncbi:MAG: AAA family ATPase, partial [Candidatus Hydrogenedentes bacterium]|nr:AAA family ATPase [Candidatus Hydrogenedentota bacterium]